MMGLHVDKKLFMQVMDIVDRLFVAMFDSLNENCKKELEAIERQYPFEPLKVIILLKLKFSSIHVRDIAFYIMKKLVECSLHGCGFFYRPMVFFFLIIGVLRNVQYLRKTLRLPFQEGVQMLKVTEMNFMFQ